VALPLCHALKTFFVVLFQLFGLFVHTNPTTAFPLWKACGNEPIPHDPKTGSPLRKLCGKLEGAKRDQKWYQGFIESKVLEMHPNFGVGVGDSCHAILDRKDSQW